MKRLIQIALVLTVVFTHGYAFSQNAGARHLLWQPSARSMALGGAGTAITEDGFAVYYNPAGLGFARRVQVAASYVKPFSFLENTRHVLNALTVRLKNFGTIAISANRFWREPLLVTTETGPEPVAIVGSNSFDYFDDYDREVKLSYATLINPHLSIGVNASLLYFKLFDDGDGSSTSLLLGAGMLVKDLLPSLTFVCTGCSHKGFTERLPFYSPKKRAGISLGISVRNIGPKITFVDASQSDSPPSLISLGLGYWSIATPLVGHLITIDFEKQLFETSLFDFIHLGQELLLADLLAIRFGYNWDTAGPRTSYFTSGFGVRFGPLSFNLARYKRDFKTRTHIDGTLSLEF